MTALLTAYRLATTAALPLVLRRQRKRFAAAGIPERLPERLGHAADPVPGAIWVHAVSVGETVSALPLVERLTERAPVLLTTTTPTAADIAAARLPDGARHAFAPLDAPGPVRRFLDAHRPPLAILVESEIWPTQIGALSARGIPIALLSARLSPRSRRAWSRAPRTARAVLSRLAYVAAQDPATADALSALGAPRVEVTGSLKCAAPLLPVDAETHAWLADRIGDRPVWVAASTHPGEEEIVADAHARIRETHPDALCLVVPRHPDRAEGIAERLGDPPRRSQGAGPDGPIYLADTMGEMGLWFSLAPAAFVGGSLRPGIGGHNPLEPARFGCAILAGPHTVNAAADFALLEEAGAVRRAADPAELAEAVRHAWSHPSEGAAARAALAPSDLPDRLARTCLELICPMRPCGPSA